MFVQSLYPEQIFVMIIRGASSRVINITSENGMGIGIAACGHFPAAIKEGMAGLGCQNGIHHDAEITAGGIFHAYRGADTAGGQPVLLITVYLIVPLLSKKKDESLYVEEVRDESLPSFLASISGPLVAVILLALRPICDIKIDPVIALPVGGIVGLLATRSWRNSSECLSYGLEKMLTVAILLVGTGTIAGIIKASEIKDVIIAMLSGWDAGGVVMAPLSGLLMSAATASTTAGATIASASFAQTVLAAGVASVWGASMTNAGATVLDHLPHGSFFHATGGSVGMQIKERMRLIPYETIIGLVLTLLSLGMYYLTTLF